MLTAVQKLVRSGAGAGSLRGAWDRLSRLPGGRALFSRLVGRAAPYTGTIGASVVALETGYSRVEMADSRRVRNHLKSIHAIALANLAELTGNVALAYSMPDDARFIVAGMEIEYLKKARGTLIGECSCPVPPTSERKEYLVPVSIRDQAGNLVAKATLRSLVGPVRRAA